MKILYVITSLGLGGAEKVVSQLADEMCSKGHTVKIAYLTGENLVKPNSSEVEIIELNLNSVKDFPAASIKFKRLISEFQPEIIHSHMVHANIFSRTNRLITPMNKLICTAHNSNEGGKLRMLAYRLTNPLCNIFTNVSKEATSAFVKNNIVKPNKMLTVYNGVDLNKFQNMSSTLDIDLYKKTLNLDPDTKVLLAVGRFNEQKDYPNLLKAVGLLAEKRKNFKLLIAGDGELRPMIQDMIRQLSLEKFVSLLGNRDDIPELMTISDIYILSSKYEGLPTVLIEAMACEKFIIATDCGGSQEILGNTGILVPPESSSQLSEALDNVMNLNCKDISLNGRAARERAESLFSLESSIDRWLELYEK